MTKLSRFAIAIAAGCLLWTPAAAQTKPDVFPFNAAAPEPVVKGAPYSGEGVTTVKATMFDGTKLERTVTAKFYRDSQGRVRREQAVMGLEALDPATDPRAVVTIFDPVADAIFSLVPAAKMVHRLPLSSVRNLAVPAVPKLDAQVRTESLGTKDIDGWQAVGRRIITTIPAGQVGNDKPIQIIDERWESPELKVLLRSHYHDPRSGDVDYALIKIVRGEPARELFVVPAGYTVRAER